MSDHNVGTALSGRSQQGMQIRSPVLERGGLIYQVAAARREVLFTITSHDKSPWTIVGAYPVGFGDRGQHRPFAPSVFLHRSSMHLHAVRDRTSDRVSLAGKEAPFSFRTRATCSLSGHLSHARMAPDTHRAPPSNTPHDHPSLHRNYSHPHYHA